MNGPERCHCGRSLHYSDPALRARVERMIELSGGAQYIPITVGERTWLVQKHYIALHGIKASALPKLGFEEITNIRQETTSMLMAEELKLIAEQVTNEMENRRRRRMEEMPPPPPPRKERRLCLITIADHGAGFPGQDSRAVLEKCFYAWATFRPDRAWGSAAPDDAVIVAMGDGRKLPSPLKSTLLAGIISCVEIGDQGLFGADPQPIQE